MSNTLVTRDNLNMKVVLEDGVPTKEQSIIGEINTIIENDEVYSVKRQHDGQISYMNELNQAPGNEVIITTYVADLPTATTITQGNIDTQADCENYGYIWTDVNPTTGADDGTPTCKVLSTFDVVGCPALATATIDTDYSPTGLYVWSTTNELGETVAAHCRLKTGAEIAADFVASGTCTAAGYWWDNKLGVCIDAGNGHAPDGYVQGGQAL